MYAEYRRLTELIQQSGKQSEEALAKKRVDDLVFQSSILSGQFALEAERINRNSFDTLAQVANANHVNFVKTRDVAQYRIAVENFLQDLEIEVAAVGGSFAYFAKEYKSFLNRVVLIMSS